MHLVNKSRPFYLRGSETWRKSALLIRKRKCQLIFLFYLAYIDFKFGKGRSLSDSCGTRKEGHKNHKDCTR